LYGIRQKKKLKKELDRTQHFTLFDSEFTVDLLHKWDKIKNFRALQKFLFFQIPEVYLSLVLLIYMSCVFLDPVQKVINIRVDAGVTHFPAPKSV
jgi:hypothetical protein